MFKLALEAVTEPLAFPVSKLGGQPCWLGRPMWPLSRSSGKPMRFIAQIALPESLRPGGQRMAYVFMTDLDEFEYIDGTWEPEGGENAVILQPSPFQSIVDTAALTEGPTLQRGVDDRTPGGRRRFEPVELRADLIATDASGGGEDEDMFHIGGAPNWLQGEEWPAPPEAWRFLMQIDSNTSQFDVNFGDAGVAYVFVAADGRAARFLWQCC
jgi:hypothetical protein